MQGQVEVGEHPVAASPAETLVDELEVIDVDDDHAAAAARREAADRGFDPGTGRRR